MCRARRGGPHRPCRRSAARRAAAHASSRRRSAFGFDQPARDRAARRVRRTATASSSAASRRAPRSASARAVRDRRGRRGATVLRRARPLLAAHAVAEHSRASSLAASTDRDARLDVLSAAPLLRRPAPAASRWHERGRGGSGGRGPWRHAWQRGLVRASGGDAAEACTATLVAPPTSVRSGAARRRACAGREARSCATRVVAREGSRALDGDRSTTASPAKLTAGPRSR